MQTSTFRSALHSHKRGFGDRVMVV